MKPVEDRRSSIFDFDFDCFVSLWYNPYVCNYCRMRLEIVMLLEDLKQELAVVENRIETLRRHL